MSSSITFEDAIKRAVTPGQNRLLAGVALGAAESPEPQDYLAAYGNLKLDPASSPITTETVMWVASCTKLVTAVAALQCVERGMFALDNSADIDRLLPEWTKQEILTGFTDDGSPVLQPVKDRITLRQLLTHTSGVGYEFADPRLLKWRSARGEGPPTMKTPSTECYKTPLVFEPGSGFAYGGGVDLAGLMIARANQCTLEAYMRRNVFDILGMDDTSFYVGYNNIGERLMPMTTRVTPEELIDGYAPDAQLKQFLDPPDESGGAGLFASTEDYLELLKSLLRNDARLLKPESIDVLFATCLSPSAQDALNNLLSIPVIAGMMMPGEPPIGTPGAKTWSYGVGGLVALEDGEEGLRAGWMRWAGAANTTWWMDRVGGTCGFFATQLFPTGEGKHAFLNKMFHKEMVARFGEVGA
ncbi:putative penicillin-binding protein [Cucurbitaria berberidis CBS 394.84]|uniref:Penicillin-binding protein n=1 Tax=Cucurbitaria berberidis CBS 394.84 TaxID=1168544 RepID=A0A9P4GP81_9PLEO|nr:putative penicillin-binding protein [Cucurbitaria berberidis CBS 394.84]KAF1848814.1 putative penicillin-binding protein [Cucurbitaria berberidis CBS 394.84]